jgi:ribosomal protein L21
LQFTFLPQASELYTIRCLLISCSIFHNCQVIYLISISIFVTCSCSSSDSFRRICLSSTLSSSNIAQSVQPQQQITSIKDTSISEKINKQITSENVGRMFAVVHLLGKQFKVTSGDIIVLEGYWPPTIGDKIRLDKVRELLISKSPSCITHSSPLFKGSRCWCQRFFAYRKTGPTKRVSRRSSNNH